VHPRLVCAVVTAAVAATSEQSRKDLLSVSETVRFQAEDDLVDRVVNALAKWDDEQEEDSG